ncbi:uncharacterized protein LOC131010860 [Salvia miltiorrhiza]|uniref:uncharacterized protein LOC131010860 n=1 Tax=Salvia miltiorrhiza TaxID=226208 RepID=UPI0025ABE4E7|nr:uncharacterized protein LOC131010860 [Salvia miltiorrhiza]
MWGLGGSYYWRRKERGKVEGIVVVFAWMSSQEKHLNNYVDVYSSLGWNSIVCQPKILNLFFPDKAASLAQEIVNELIQELKIRPCPIIFASFSGGPKACMYKVLQIIEGKHEEQINQDECRLVRDSISGYIFDSCPVDFVSDLGKRFILHQTGFKISRPPLVASWITSGISSTMEALFLSRLESQRAEYWQTLYSTVSFRAPYLILCSEDDELAPFQIIFNFASRLKNLGADVKLVKWNKSSHVGHFRHHPEEYSAAVTELLRKAAITYSQRIRQLEGEKMGVEGGNDEISDPFNGLRKAAAVSREAVDLNDYFDVPSSVEYQEDRDEYIALWRPPKMSAHGVVGEFLFDVCVPKNVEDWDLRFLASTTSAAVASGRPFNPIKSIRRSRL